MSSPIDDEASPSERLRSLELKARAIRSRLIHTVDALDARRHQAVAVGNYAKVIAKPAALSLLGLVAVVGIGAFAIRYVFRARKARSFSVRASRAIQQLDLVPKPSLGSRIVEKALVSILTLAATEVMSQLGRRFVVEKTNERVRFVPALPQAH